MAVYAAEPTMEEVVKHRIFYITVKANKGFDGFHLVTLEGCRESFVERLLCVVTIKKLLP